MMFQDRRFEPERRGETPRGRRQVTLLELVSRIWKAKLWALAGGLLFGLACVAVLPFLKPVYEASSQIYIDPQDLQLLKNDLTPAVSGGDSGVLIVESQVRVMQSASVLKLVVKNLDLTQDKEFGGGGSGFLSSLLGRSGQTSTDPVDQAVQNLEKNINVVREDRTYIITVYARSHDAARAAEISNAVVNAYLQVRDMQRTDQANSAADTLDSRLATLQAAVKVREDAVEKFKADNNIVDTNGVVLAESRLGQNNTVVATAEDAMNKRKVERDQLQQLLAHPEQFLSSPVATASPDLMRLRGELDRAETQLSLLEVTLGARHPRILVAKSGVAAVRRAIDVEMSRLARNADIAYDRAKSDYDAAVASLKPLVSQVQDIDTARIQLRQLQRDADSTRAVYEEALTRSRQAREQGLVNTLNAQIITLASTPLRRKSPPSAKVMLVLAVGLGMCLGLASGIGYGLLRESEGKPAPARGRRPNPVPTRAPARAPNPAPVPNSASYAATLRERHRRASAASLLDMAVESPRPATTGAPLDARRW
ncbi:MAG: GumC family protein [Mesorhizobium sp.]|nr:GumC family protein [Mesorhizobium sp.]MBN9245634.1 GumC family protein [Mesorhizobium sp.]